MLRRYATSAPSSDSVYALGDHRRAGHAVADDVREIAIGFGVAKSAAAQVGARHRVAALAVADDAVAGIELRAVLDVGLLVLARVRGRLSPGAAREQPCAADDPDCTPLGARAAVA